MIDENARPLSTMQSSGAKRVGIDLGASKTIVSFCRSDSSPQDIILAANELSNRSTPTIVALDGKNRLVGEAAENRFGNIKGNSVPLLPIFMSAERSDTHRRFQSIWGATPGYETNARTFFSVAAPSESTEAIQAFKMGDGDRMKVYAEHIAAMFLKQMYKFAEGGPLKGHLCIAVPPTICGPLRSYQKAFKEACEIAGITSPVEVIETPEAVANAWVDRNLSLIDNLLKDAQGTINAARESSAEQLPTAVVNVSPTVVVGFLDVGFSHTSTTALAVWRDLHTDGTFKGPVATQVLFREVLDDMGAFEFICVIQTYVLEALRKKHGDEAVAFATSAKKSFRLHTLCARAMKELSGLPSTYIDLESCLPEDTPRFQVEITRELFESLCSPFVERLRQVLSRLNEALFSKFDIQGCLLVSTNPFAQMQQSFAYERNLQRLKSLLETAAPGATADRGLTEAASAEGDAPMAAEPELGAAAEDGSAPPLPATSATAAAPDAPAVVLNVPLVLGIELVGGGTRIPWVQNAVENSLISLMQHLDPNQTADILMQGDANEEPISVGKALQRRTLDSNSCVAHGACLVAINRRHVPLHWRLDGKGEDVSFSELPLDTPDRSWVESIKKVEEDLIRLDQREKERMHWHNRFESYVLQMQSEISSSKFKDLLNDKEGKVHGLLAEADDWIMSAEDVSLEEYRDRLNTLEAEVRSLAPDFFTALEKEKQEKEENLRKATEQTRRENEREGITRDKDTRKLPNPQRIKLARKNKDEGNEYFASGHWEFASERYLKALEHLSKVFDASPQDREEADNLSCTCNLNMAQVYIKLDTEVTLKKAISACTTVLGKRPNEVKAFYRRAIAHEHLKDYESAQADLKAALKIAPKDSELLKAKQRVDQHIKLQSSKAKKVFARMLG